MECVFLGPHSFKKRGLRVEKNATERLTTRKTCRLIIWAASGKSARRVRVPLGDAGTLELGRCAVIADHRGNPGTAPKKGTPGVTVGYWHGTTVHLDGPMIVFAVLFFCHAGNGIMEWIM